MIFELWRKDSHLIDLVGQDLSVILEQNAKPVKSLPLYRY